MLMWRMSDFVPGHVEDALGELGVTRQQMRAAHNRWVQMAYSRTAPSGLAKYRWALGPPNAVERRMFGDLPCKANLWELPYWPDLRFEVLAAPDGSMWNQWLVRAPGASAPEIKGLDDLTTWSCVVSDVGEAFPGSKHVEGDAPSRWGVAFDYQGSDYLATFVHGLLQTVQEGGPR
jgi:hypothetical protein